MNSCILLAGPLLSVTGLPWLSACTHQVESSPPKFLQNFTQVEGIKGRVRSVTQTRQTVKYSYNLAQGWLNWAIKDLKSKEN